MIAYLGMDIGTSGTKALVLAKDGRVLAAAEAAHPIYTPKPGWSEQIPEDWWQSAITATRAVIKKAKLRGAEISGIGLSGQMHGSVFLDARGTVLRPALLWNDQRTAEQCLQITQLAGGRDALLQMVANPALTGFTAPKILWLRQHEPKRYAKLAQVLLPKDYIRYRLTGEYATEVSDASGTLLLDVKRRGWHIGLVEKLGLDPLILPKVWESAEISGVLTTKAAAEFGLQAGTPVVGGAGDQAAGAVGTGVVSAGLISASMGTSGVIFAASDEPRTDPLGRVHTMCHAIPSTWCVFGCMLSAGGSLQWLRNTLFTEQIAALQRSKKDLGKLYPLMMQRAAAAEAGCENLFFLPYLTGERCPHADPYATGCFVGLTPRHGQAELIRSVVEGITFGMTEQVGILREMGVAIKQVRASGGGARSEFWRQLQADMYNAPVVTVNASEGAALGAAVLAGVGVGAWRDVAAATHAVISVESVCRPNRKAAILYQQQLTKYASLYNALRDSFAKLATQ